MTVRDVIEHLRTLPQDMEVWVTWDESGEYWPATDPQGRIDHVVERVVCGKKGWREARYGEQGKAVCVLAAPIG